MVVSGISRDTACTFSSLSLSLGRKREREKEREREREMQLGAQAFRDNHRIAVEDEALAEQLWDKGGLCHICADLRYNGNPPVGLNSNIRFYRYSAGQKFSKHVDGSYQLASGAETGYTLLVYLNGGNNKKGGLVGGETMFYGERGERLLAVTPKCGMALLHLHGEECMEHEGALVRSGCKYILRSDVLFQ